MRLIVLTALVAASPLLAQQQSRADRFLRNCDDTNWGDDRERFCEVRDLHLKPSGRVSVDGRENGGVAFYGWDRNEVLVRALVSASGDSRAEAESLAKQITIDTSTSRIRADGPRNRRYSHWAVSYEVFVPRKTDLDADTENGGVQVEGVEGRMELHAVNGGIGIRDAAGDVRAETTNGGVTAELTGSTWKGAGLDLETTNGGVTLDIPTGYSAELETGTVNGGMNIDFPITIKGSISRRISTRLGNGGPRIRATTTNGGVRIRER
ncbi:MAG TPA: DUF4097 family beta strand repeat-containing protein [Gemmatimonadaceae bacterium]|nr:DUF4097 family beta strand repeat-containing protein [Gemmatimonadaceae bacterium]